MSKIDPTVGRVVLFRPHPPAQEGEQPMAATVAHVNGDDGTVNLSVVDHQGHQYGRQRVPLVQPGETPPETGGWCEWMQYQIETAAKAAAK